MEEELIDLAGTQIRTGFYSLERRPVFVYLDELQGDGWFLDKISFFEAEPIPLDCPTAKTLSLIDNPKDYINTYTQKIDVQIRKYSTARSRLLGQLSFLESMPK